MTILENGKPLLGSFLPGDDFHDLGEDEIYSHTPLYDEDEVLIPPARHRVLFIRYRVTKERRGVPDSLNSHCKEFDRMENEEFISPR